MQIAYGGTKTTYRVGERVICAPSAVSERGTGTMGKPMTIEEILMVKDAFANAALTNTSKNSPILYRWLR